MMLSFIIFALVTASATARSIGISRAAEHRVTRQDVALPSSFKWTSTQALVSPKNDDRKIDGIKDPSIVFQDGTYHVFASTAQSAGYNLVYFNFTDFNDANSSTFAYLDQSAIGTGYRAAPQVFYFEPQKLWYLVFQDGNGAYSTNEDIGNPMGWSAIKHFYSGVPKIIEDNLEGGYWLDFWVICDAENCHLFSSDDLGRLYRSQTPISSFPEGMSEPVIAMSEPRKEDLFEAANVYTIGESQYLLLVECIGSVGRYFRSWTATDIAGPWEPLAATEENPFLGASNVEFDGTVWTKDISHGEVIRTVVDQSLTITPCNMRFFYQGVDPNADTEYNALPWRLALLTQQDSDC
jgi:hypothetical protein